MKLQLPFLLVPLEYLLHKENIEKNCVLMNAIFHFKLLEVYLFFIPSLLLLPSGRCDWSNDSLHFLRQKTVLF